MHPEQQDPPLTERPYVLVDSQEGLVHAAQALSACSHLYMDTEFDSGRGPTRLCLLQISSGTEIFLIDTLKLGELDVLARALGRPDVEWVMHAGLQDLELIQRRLGLRAPERLLDTQVAYALVSAENNVSLAYLCRQLLGAVSHAGHQADDWVRRPLSESQLRYAAGDVQHLPALAALLTERAEAKNRLAFVFEASHEALEPSREPAAALSIESFRNAWQLSPRSQAGLRFLIDWYERLSVDDKRGAPDMKALLAVAARMPESVDALARIKGAPPAFVKRHGKEVVEGMRERALRAASSDFVPLAPAPYATFTEIRHEGWLGLLRAEVCASLEVSPEHVLPTRVMRELKAKLQGSHPVRLSDALHGYRKRLLGSAVDEFCERQPPPLL
jgi:ribonuclease D